MKFYNRNEELKELEIHKNITLRKEKSVLIVITGIRRVGKTELIKKFFMKKKGIYFYVDNEKSNKKLMDEFIEVMKQELKLPDYVKADKWEDFLSILFDEAKRKPMIVAIDEFQRFLKIEPSFINQLQKYFDLRKDESKLFLILSGSSIGMIKKIFEERRAPLFGRAHNRILLTPFDFITISEILNDLKIKEFESKIEFYSLFGGIPKYYVLLEDYSIKKPNEAIEKLVLRDMAPLRREVKTIITEEFGKDTPTYYGILTAIASGMTKLNEIANYVGIKETSIGPYIYDLSETLEIIKRKIPITEPKKSKKGRYFLNDNFFRFWFKFIHRNMSYYESGEYEYIKNLIYTQFNSFTSLAFEDICKEFLEKLNENNKLHFKFNKIGKWWHKDKEIDIVALNEETGDILFGECKWSNKNIGIAEIMKLKETSKSVSWFKKRKEHFVLFSKTGFNESCLDYCEKNNILTFDLKDMERHFI